MDTFLKIPDQSWQQLIIKIKDFPVQFDDSYLYVLQNGSNKLMCWFYMQRNSYFLIRALESILFLK